MKLSSTLPVLTLAFALTAPIALLARNDDANNKLPNGPTADQATTAKLVYGLLSDSRYAYRPRALDDALSQDVYKRYLEALDPGKLFFSAEDIKTFAPNATKFDDAIKSGDMAAPYAMFAVYKQRVAERVGKARAQLKQADKFNFNGADRYEYDREDAPWATSAQLDTLWAQSVRNDWLRLKLAGKQPDEIRKTLDKRYANLVGSVDDLNGEDVFQTFLNSYAGSIDPHTDYFTPRTAANFNLTMSLSLEGIGAVLQKQDEVVVIREIVPGGPAARSNRLKPGDRIVAVGQGTSGEMKDVIGWRIDDVVELIRGPKNTPVRLDVVPAEASVDAKPSRLVITRDKVRLEEQAAKAQTIDVPGQNGASKKIGVIKLPAFYQDFEGRRKNANDYASATRDVARLLAQLKLQKVDGVVLDLRNNGGGSLTEAVELTGLFIDQGPVVQVRESGGRVSVEDDSNSGVAWDGPFAVLINRGSASASEIFAGAIQDYGRGLVIGETTFGKGTVQNLIDLDRWPANEESRFGQVKLTIAQFFRVSGGSTQHKGVVPDIRFPVTVDASEFGESTYDNALPWTRIAAVPHTQYGNFAPLLPRLDALHATRVAKDKEFQWWSEDVAQFREEQAKKFVSLNEADRRAERDKFETKRKTRQAERKALGLPLDPFAETDNDDGLQANERNIADEAKRDKLEEKRPDPLLRESAAILADALTLLNGDRQLSQQVLPASRTMGHWSE